MSSLLVAAVSVATLLVVAVFVVARSRRRRRLRRPAREPSAFVILEKNAWESCAIDDLHERWSRLATEPVRGFCGVPSGRHRVCTTTPAGEATLDFVIYPGEILAWRLDADRARWEPHDLDPDTRSSLESAPSSTLDVAAAARTKLPGWLVHLRTTAGLVSSRGSGLGRSTTTASKIGDDGVERVRKRLAKVVGRAETDAASAGDELLHEARGLGESLIGRILTRRQLRALVAPACEAASRLCAHGDTARAMDVLAIGLAVLPGAPELMVAAGCTLAARGETDEAMRALNAALERDRCLEAEDVARAMRARMDLRSPLGRSVRV